MVENTTTSYEGKTMTTLQTACDAWARWYVSIQDKHEPAIPQERELLKVIANLDELEKRGITDSFNHAVQLHTEAWAVWRLDRLNDDYWPCSLSREEAKLLKAVEDEKSPTVNRDLEIKIVDVKCKSRLMTRIFRGLPTVWELPTVGGIPCETPPDEAVSDTIAEVAPVKITSMGVTRISARTGSGSVSMSGSWDTPDEAVKDAMAELKSAVASGSFPSLPEPEVAVPVADPSLGIEPWLTLKDAEYDGRRLIFKKAQDLYWCHRPRLKLVLPTKGTHQFVGEGETWADTHRDLQRAIILALDSVDCAAQKWFLDNVERMEVD